MAVDQGPVFATFLSGSTIAQSTDSSYKIAFAAGTAKTVLVGDPGTTSVAAKPVGVYYGSGTYTTTTDAEAIKVAIGGIVKLRCAASTVSVGELLAASSNGLGCTPTTNMWVVGRQIDGSSGGANHVVSVLWFPAPVLYSARLAGTT